jgi:FMN-dependent NADH-azoreductase
MSAVERSRAAKRARRSEVILRPLAAETFIPEMDQTYINAIQQATNYKYSALSQEIYDSIRTTISEFCHLQQG